MQYPKINSLWKRADDHSLLEGMYSLEEFALPRYWQVQEKIDGTNIRVHYWMDMYDSAYSKVTIYGRTDESDLPKQIVDHIQGTFGTTQRIGKVFPCREDGTYPNVWLYGEGYGPKIQKGGGNYRKDPGFMLFDVFVEGNCLCPQREQYSVTSTESTMQKGCVSPATSGISEKEIPNGQKEVMSKQKNIMQARKGNSGLERDRENQILSGSTDLRSSSTKKCLTHSKECVQSAGKKKLQGSGENIPGRSQLTTTTKQERFEDCCVGDVTSVYIREKMTSLGSNSPSCTCRSSGWWLEQSAVQRIAKELGIPYAPIIGTMTTDQIVEYVKSKPLSLCSITEQVMEGVICRTDPLLLLRNGKPLMFKLKCKEF